MSVVHVVPHTLLRTSGFSCSTCSVVPSFTEAHRPGVVVHVVPGGLHG